MTWTDMTHAERLQLYRSNHTIARMPLHEIVSGTEFHCEVDGLRILPVKGGRWRHDPGAIERLVKAVPYVSEIDGDGLSEAKRAREIVIEDHDGYLVTADLPE